MLGLQEVCTRDVCVGFAGGLVKKILGTKKELESQPAKKTEIVGSILCLLL